MIMLCGCTLCFHIFSCKYMWLIMIKSMMIMLPIIILDMIMHADYFVSQDIVKM